MNPTFDTAGTNGGEFDPQQAASLLNQSTQQAQRHLEQTPPWFLAARAGLALVAYGALWLSTRGQHPYHYPTAAVGPAEAAVGIANVTAVAVMAKRASAGIVGRNRFRPLDLVVAVAVWVLVLTGLAALAGSGASDSITWGYYPAAAPPIAAGLAWAAMMAYRRNRRGVVTGVAAAVVGGLSLLAGPSGAWAVCGIGFCALLLAKAAFIARQQRRRVTA
ncbi:MAG: hypothetical protein JO016_13225 [Actinobacteria bacterium]|nr:hypothetical protein [Actinomycetota bacterium]